MNNEQCRELTELLGECWHDHGGYAAGPGYCQCRKCGERFNLMNHNPNRTFDNPNDVYWCITKLKEMGVLLQFMSFVHRKWNTELRCHPCDWVETFKDWLALSDRPQEQCLLILKFMKGEFLNNNCHPHISVIISTTHAELLEGVCAFTTNEYIKD